MKNQNSFIGYLLIGIGAFYLLKELRVPILTDFYSWPTLLIVIGISFLLHSYLAKEYGNLFIGVLLLGLGIHFHALNQYPFWIDDWGMYTLIVGVAFFISYLKTKSGLFPGLILLAISFFALFASNKPNWFNWINQFVEMAIRFWPVVLVLIGVYLLVKKK
ncbi:LiaI-LiaF-like domain-containing protein [Aquibacillus salsiterrae]|uniref:DUF5668 domain-containing protein n=1 Tax=Aquibacillus salsiterrae TaxID=2950439 RepID=A0A9X4AF50_9BACI|nr:DUF5668 domain-containing protein [Aquibacillus salsiterrae]MDC3415688.1 DUF5668 domain-containing protein [Aquibacillus salsiterrae]